MEGAIVGCHLIECHEMHSGADITSIDGLRLSASATDALPRHFTPQNSKRFDLLRNFVACNLNITQAFASHPKIMVVGLNGPAVGLTAAMVAFGDFIYAVPHTFLLTPFSSLGLVAEGGASRALVQRLGVSKANEALMMSRRISSDDLLATGFVNQVFADCGPGEDDKFRQRVLREIDERLGHHLNGASLVRIKALMRRPERDVIDLQNVNEVFAGLGRFMTGEPEEEFRRLAAKEKRHKL
jgi:Delta3-Delta2-enoyl-CoA isomerase